MNNVFTEDSFSSKLRNIVQFECAVMLLENPQCLGLNFENVWEILNFEFFFWSLESQFNKTKVLEGKISGVISSHSGQWHMLH